MNLYPALLSGSIEKLQSQIDLVNDDERIATLQIDIIDGLFADNLTITPADIPDLDLGRFQYDIHLLTEEPLDYIFELQTHCQHAQIRACIAQVEKMSYQQVFIEEVHRHDWKVGLSLDLYTPLEAIDEESWPNLDVLQLMAIEAGFQGNKFSPTIFDKIKRAQALIEISGKPIELIVDGGVSLENIQQLSEAGVISIAVGSTLWRSDNPIETITKLLMS
ncbi:MAG: hypothetical protein COY80_01390 [Candidatus Pacebacteria bacterium CG_4_10_14_0_8_um_filter_42_14]|nr:MAG: hypothetical protein COY80_01390 [Candidatus Pacebacteria bacterium CG_4_10_14_0_8_um_filter_42_14]